MWRLLSLFLWSLWVGIGFGVTFVAIPVVFGSDIRNALPPGQAGRVAQSILLRLFQWQVGIVALAAILYFLEQRRNPASAGRLRAWLLPPLGAISLLALFWLHPLLAGIHAERYDIHTQEPQRRQLAARFGVWHGISQVGNLLILLGTSAAWWNTAQRLRRDPHEIPVKNAPTKPVGL